MFKFFCVIFSFFCLCGCRATMPQNSIPHNTPELINLNINGVKQFAISDENNLFIINEQGELWDTQKQLLLATHLSTEHAVSAKNQHIATVDHHGHFLLWTPTQIFSSQIKISKHAQFLMLEDAIIAVYEDTDAFYLIRIEQQNDTIQITAKSSMPVLPDARPILVNLSHETDEKHIALLTHPDRTTYPHGVIGDAIEAKTLHYLDKKTLLPLATPLSIDGLIFEGNKVNVLQTQPNQLVSVVSGNGLGARVITIQLKDNALQKVAQSTPLPHNRWQDVFTQNDKLYAVHMPHLKKELVHYQLANDHLQHHSIGNNVSTHQIGSYETNLVGITSEFIVLPQANYHALAWLDNKQQLHFFTPVFASVIKQIKSVNNIVYVFLNDGTLWKIQ